MRWTVLNGNSILNDLALTRVYTGANEDAEKDHGRFIDSGDRADYRY